MFANLPSIIVTPLLFISPGIWLFLFGGLGAPEISGSYRLAEILDVIIGAVANSVLYAMVGAFIAALQWVVRRKNVAK